MQSMSTIFEKLFDNRMEGFETAFPAIIDKVNGDGTLDVVPCVKNCLSNMQMEPTPGGRLNPIQGVPLVHSGTASLDIAIEPSEGDTVLCVAMSRDIREWVKNGYGKGPYNPQSFGGCDVNSLVAVQVRMAGNSEESKYSVSIGKDGSAFFGNGNGKIEMAKDGKVTINGHLEVQP